MELQEAYELTQISHKEISAIERYLGFKHTSINVLADLSASRFRDLVSSGWSLPESTEELKDSIADFVDLYSAMYKDSRGRGVRGNLIRGTSTKDVPKGKGTINHMISTTTDEEIAKRFCKYGDAALVRFRVGEGVPFIIAEDYRDENSATENEVLLAPFCEVTRSKHTSSYNGYEYYDIHIAKPELEELSEKDLEILMKDVVSSFSQNIEKMKACNEASDRYEILSERLGRTFDQEEKSYVFDKKQEAFEEYSAARTTTDGFKEKLRRLLKGLCKQKELEIDKAYEVIDAERKRAEEETKKQQEAERAKQEASEKEIRRKSLYIDLSSKSLKSPAEALDLQNILTNTYNNMLRTETNSIALAEKLGVPYSPRLTSTDLGKRIDEIKENIRILQEKTEDMKISEEDTLEALEEVSKTTNFAFDGISYGLEIAKDIPEISKLFKQQSDRDIKKVLYQRVQNAIEQAKVQKYLRDRDVISKEGIGFLSGLTGKSELQIERLNNVNLKIQLAQSKKAEPQKVYSVRSMLADLYVCAVTELGGNFTPEMQTLYDSMKSIYTDANIGAFTDDYIGKLARDKIMAMQSNLPMVQEPKRGFFGRRKNQIELLRAENKGLEVQIAEEKNKGVMGSLVVDEPDAVSLFESKIKGVSFATRDRSNDLEVNVLQDTAPLWE